jgi:hypothetical protein
MESRINVILDLDNTIINALEEEERKALPVYFQDKFFHKDMIPFFRVFARPHLEEFLDYLFENFNVAVFTAAEHTYAKFIIDNFILTKPGRKLEAVFFRYHFDLAHKLYNKTKGLEVLWDFFHVYNFYPCNTVIIDDLIDVKKSNPYNTIAVEAFEMVTHANREIKPNWDAVNDADLLRVINRLDKIKGQWDLSDCVKMIYNQKPRFEPILTLFE